MFRILFLIACVSCNIFAGAEILDVDFDKSMGIESRARFNTMFQRDGKPSKLYYDTFKKLYETHLPSKTDISSQLRIPKTIHYVWVGPKPMPKWYEPYIRSCKNVNSDWEIKIWDNNALSELIKDPQFSYLEPQKYFDILNAIPSYSAQKDLISYLILYKYGGVYMDLDYECLKPMEEVHYKYDMYTTLEPPNTQFGFPTLSGSLVGSNMANPILLDAFNIAADNILNYEKNRKNIFRVFFQKLKYEITGEKTIVYPNFNAARSTMLPLGDAIVNRCSTNECPNIIVFPATYFNPVFYLPIKESYSYIDRFLIKIGVYKDINVFDRVYPETIASQDWFDKQLGDYHDK